MGWGWSAPGSGAVGRGRAALLSCWPPFGAPVWSVKRPVSPHTPWGTARSCQALLRPSRRTEAGEWGGPSCRPSGTQAARELGTGASQEGGCSPSSSCRPDLLLGGSGSPRPVTQCPGPSLSGGRAGVTASVPGPARGDCSPGLPMALLAGAEHRGPPHPQSSRAAASKGARLPCTRRSLRSLLAPAGPSRLSHVLQTLHVRPEPEPQCPPLNALGITGPAPGRLDSVILTGTASPSLGAPCWSPHGSWDPKALPRTLRADPGQWLVCSGPRGSTSAEGPSFGGPAGLPTALVQPDPSATPRVTVRPQPLDLLGPHKATSPGNPIPLGALLWRLPGPPRASQGTAQPKPWFARSPPDPGPRVCLRWGGGCRLKAPLQIH